ncbi:hypothetical protein K488DRAFT_87583 [Vararia minispora EC-137]|uniref:Uncharacterized protein n=1 Tax=Vararia minispora EC-137 TaxID=1314806 RepID=A0ACB8QH39_9AGAM|nr:hypothetical protein K488DRAFT_87583 [Vararia minispora EC-137]
MRDERELISSWKDDNSAKDRHRSLPHFTDDDFSLEVRSLVENSHLRGLTLQELFFHAIADLLQSDVDDSLLELHAKVDGERAQFVGSGGH